MPKQMPVEVPATHRWKKQMRKNAAHVALQTLLHCAASAWLSILAHWWTQKVERGRAQKSKSSRRPQEEQGRAAGLQQKAYSFLQVVEEEDCYHE